MFSIEVDGNIWPSISHYYEGSKFKKEHPEFSMLFSENSNSDISKDPYLATAIGDGEYSYYGKVINPERIILWDTLYEYI